MPVNGVLVVDKPAGPTSHDIVDRVRKALGVRRAGHTGTLDPFATGVLAVCLDKATRLVRFLAQGDKLYRATVHLGFATTTDDLHGQPLGDPVAVRVDPEALERACRDLTGEQLQVPPAYSAKRVGGHRHYEMARRGQAVQPVAAPVGVYSLKVLEASGDRVELEVRCSPGTYIRALARDLGKKLGVGAHLVALRRTRSGAFSLEEAVSGDALGPAVVEHVRPLSALLPELPGVVVNREGLDALRHGRDLDRGRVAAGFPESGVGHVRVLDESGALVGLAVPKGFGFEAPGLRLEPVLHPDIVLLDEPS